MITGSLLIVGAAVSVIINMLKARYKGMRGWQTRLIVILISLGLAAVYHILVAFKLMDTAYMILATASTVYAFFFSKK